MEVKGKVKYSFPGGGEYYPVTIEAETDEEAFKKWEKERVSITQ